MINRIRTILMAGTALYFTNGQSTSVGYTATPAITTAQLYGATMFSGGLRVVEFDTGLNMDAPVVPATERNGDVLGVGETGTVAGGHMFHEKLADYSGVPIPAQGFNLHEAARGRGGASLLQITKGGTYYADWLLAVQKSPKPNCYLVTNLTIGETDQSRGEEGYDWQERLIDWHEDYVADAMKITGQPWTPFTVCNQMASHWRYASDPDPITGYPNAHKTPEIALAMWRAALEHQDIFCPFARYVLDNTDRVHHDNLSEEMKGKLQGRATAKITAARMADEPDPVVAVQPVSVNVTGNVITVSFARPYGALQFRHDWVAATWNEGFDFWQADRVTLLDIITGVTIIGANRVQITCSSPPPAGAVLTYGWGRPGMTESGRTLGPRGCLCDSEGDLDFYTDINGTVRRLDNYCLIFETKIPPTTLTGGETWDIRGEARDYTLKRQAVQIAAGEVFPPNGFGFNGTPSAVTANTLYAVRTDNVMRVSGLAVHVTTAAAGSVRVGLYSVQRNGRPGALIEDLGSQSTATTGQKTFNFAAPRQFDGRAYMLVALFEAAPLIVRGTTTSSSVAATNGAPDMLSTTGISHWTASLAFGALPKIFPALARGASSSPPMIALVGA